MTTATPISTLTIESMSNEQIIIPPWERIAVDAKTASQMMSCGYSTFFKRVKANLYPKPGPDGNWSVNALRAVHQANSPTTSSTPDA